jgi:flagellar biogenesis protein FliO
MATTTPSPEGLSWLRFLLAASTVTALLGLLALGLKYLASRGWATPMKSASKRLAIVESLTLDARRRLVIVRCDATEHLLLLGQQQDSVVATNLKPLPSSSTTPDQHS